MKIIHHIYDHIDNPRVGGGGAVLAYESCKRLSANGHEVTILSGKYPGAHDDAESGVSFRFIGSAGSYFLSTFSYAFEAAKFVKKRGDGFDIIVEDYAPVNPVFSFFNQDACSPSCQS